VVDYLFGFYGPTNRAYGTLNEAGKKAFHEELPTLWSRNNTATEGTTMLSGESIEIISIQKRAYELHLERCKRRPMKRHRAERKGGMHEIKRDEIERENDVTSQS
jgi:hypothetical protein